MTAVPALPTVLPASGKITSTNWGLMVAYLAFQRNPPRFKGSITSATALTASTPIKFPSIYDTASGYNVSTGQYTVQYPGTYRIQTQLKWNTAPGSATQLLVVINSTISIISPAASLITEGGPQLACEFVFAAGDVVSFQVDVGFTTIAQSGADNNFAIMTWTGQ